MAPSIRASDADLRAAVRTQLETVERAAKTADQGRGGPDAVQAQYDAARDLVESLRSSLPVSVRCKPLWKAATAFAAAHVLQAEGFDRPSAAMVRLGVTRATTARARIDDVTTGCRAGRADADQTEPELARPRSGEAFYGLVEARVPAELDRLAVVVDGRQVGTTPATDGIVSGLVTDKVAVGRHTISLRSLPGDLPAFRATSRGVWLLPISGQRVRPEGDSDSALAARLDTLVARFRGYAAVWVHDLSTGATAAANAEARFPAASTVKLGLLVAGLQEGGQKADTGPLGYDLAAMTLWSSNLATNRLLVEVGGSESAGATLAQAALARMGATSTTFTGGYRAGTSIRSPGAPPAISARITTAHDLGRVLYAIHAAALGNAAWLRRTGLTQHQARLALGWLLSSQPRFDNIGLLRPLLGNLPIAQKNGWFSVVRHTAGIVYLPDGPKIVVVLTYADNLTLVEATAFAAKVLQAASIRA